MNKVGKITFLAMIILFIGAITNNNLIYAVMGIQLLQLTFILEILYGSDNK